METLSQRKPPSQRPLGEPVRVRSTMICLAAAVALGLVSLAGTPTLRRQLIALNPSWVSSEQRSHRAGAMSAAIISQGRGEVVRQAFDQMYRRNDASPIIERLTERDPENGLYQHLFLLSQLRQKGPTTQPSQWSQIQEAIRLSEQAPPVRLYQRTIEDQVASALVRSGEDPREAAALTQRTINEFLLVQHRPVLRELADRLLHLGDELRGSKQLADARRVDNLAARILLEIVTDSPTYDVALLSAERLPRALDGIAKTAALKQENAKAEQARSAAQAVAAFPRDWHKDARDEDINIIPFSGGIVANLAYSAQRTLLGTFTRTLVITAFYLVFGALVLILASIWIISPSARAVPLTWRGRMGPLMGCAIALASLMVLLIVTFVGRLSFTWIFTAQTGLAIVSFLFTCPLAVALAARVAIRFPEPLERQRVSILWIGVVLGLMIVLPLAMSLAFPSQRSAARPPLLVQYFRRELALAGIFSVPLTLAWFIAGQVRRLKGEFPKGLIARSQLAVLAQVILVVAVVMSMMMVANKRQDEGHMGIYAAATQDVVSTQLGPKWQAQYFGPAQMLIQSQINSPSH